MTASASPVDHHDAFSELGRIVLGDEPLEQILERIVHIATEVLPFSCDASITLLTGRNAVTPAFSSDVALGLDERQYADETGPCLDAAMSGTRILIANINTEQRWPRFVHAARDAAVQSSLSIPLPVQRQLTGALNFYAFELNAFDDQSIDLAETFAAHAAVAVANAHLYEATAQLAAQMQEAMATRAVIEQAKGIVMRDRGCSPDEAFEAMVRLSQESHVKLRDLARRLVEQVAGTDHTG